MLKKKLITLLAVAGLVLALAPTAQTATIAVSEWNVDFTLPGNDTTSRVDKTYFIGIGTTGGQQLFGDFRFTAADIGTLITGAETADTYVDAADFNANAEVTLEFTLVEENVAVAATGTITIFTDTVAGIAGHVGVQAGASLGTTPGTLGAHSLLLTADADGHELGAMFTDQADWADPNSNQYSEYSLAGVQLVVTRATTTPGDTNGNGIVDAYDLDRFENQFGGAPSGDSADFDDNGIVDLDDFAILRGNWLFGVVPTAPEPAPEPATMSLLALGGLMVLRRRRKA